MIFVRLDKVVEIWDIITQKKLSCHNDNVPTDDIDNVVLSPDGRSVAAVRLDQTMEVENAITGGLICTYRDHADQVNSVV